MIKHCFNSMHGSFTTCLPFPPRWSIFFFLFFDLRRVRFLLKRQALRFMRWRSATRARARFEAGSCALAVLLAGRRASALHRAWRRLASNALRAAAKGTQVASVGRGATAMLHCLKRRDRKRAANAFRRLVAVQRCFLAVRLADEQGTVAALRVVEAAHAQLIKGEAALAADHAALEAAHARLAGAEELAREGLAQTAASLADEQKARAAVEAAKGELAAAKAVTDERLAATDGRLGDANAALEEARKGLAAGAAERAALMEQVRARKHKPARRRVLLHFHPNHAHANMASHVCCTRTPTPKPNHRLRKTPKPQLPNHIMKRSGDAGCDDGGGAACVARGAPLQAERGHEGRRGQADEREAGAQRGTQRGGEARKRVCLCSRSCDRSVSFLRVVPVGTKPGCPFFIATFIYLCSLSLQVAGRRAEKEKLSEALAEARASVASLEASLQVHPRWITYPSSSSI